MNKFKDNIVNNLDTYKSVVKALYDNPEIGLQEYESSKLLAKTIEDLGIARVLEIQNAALYRYNAR